MNAPSWPKPRTRRSTTILVARPSGQLSDAGQITTIIDEFLRTGIDEVLVGRWPTGARTRAWPLTSPVGQLRLGEL